MKPGQNRRSSSVEGNSAPEAEAVAVDGDDAVVVEVDTEREIKVNTLSNLYVGRKGGG
jgi:hypothetical protein